MNSKNSDRDQRILLVDDDQHLLQSMGQWLNECGYETRLAQNLASAKQLLESETHFDLALIDLRLGPEDGFDLLDYLSLIHI